MISIDTILADMERLPTLPLSLARIMNLADDETASMRDIEEAIRPDPALTATVLRLANSVFFGCSREITSLRQAATLPGANKLAEAATGGALARLVPKTLPGYGIDAVEFFRHSVAVAVICERMGAELDLGDRGALFTCGLLHDVGKLLVSDHLARQPAAMRGVREERCTFVEAEREILGLDHAEVGGAMAAEWDLPTSLCTVVRRHHEPEQVTETAVDAIHVADGLAHAMGYGADKGELARRINPGALERIGAPVRELERIMSQAVEQIESMSASFSEA